MKRATRYTVAGRHWGDRHDDEHPPGWTVIRTGCSKERAELLARVMRYGETTVRPGGRAAFERWARSEGRAA